MCERVSPEQWLNLVDEAINKAKTIFDDDHVICPLISSYFDTHDQGAQLLYELLKMWRKYKQLLCWLSRMLEPLDKMYFAGEGHSLQNIGITYFCDEVSEDRKGKPVDRELINNTIGFLLEIDAVARRDYYNAFENALRVDSGLYYSRLASTWIHNDTFSVYINKVERILHEEERRIRYFLPQETIERLLEHIRGRIVDENAISLVQLSERLSPEQWLNLVDEAINKTKSIFDDDRVVGFEPEELIDISFTIVIRVAEDVGKVQAVGMLVIKNVRAYGGNVLCGSVREDGDGKPVDKELVNNTIGFLMETNVVARRDYYNVFENALRGRHLWGSVSGSIKAPSPIDAAFEDKEADWLAILWDKQTHPSQYTACLVHYSHARDSKQLHQFMMGLFDDYEDRRSSLLNRNLTLTLAAVLVEIKSEEVQKKTVVILRNPKNKNSVSGYTPPRSLSPPATIVIDTVVSALPSSSTSTMELNVDELAVVSNYRLSQTGRADWEGIIAQTSCPGISEQNSIAERKHIHIMETSNTLLRSSSLPKSLWGEAILTAVYTINRTPSVVLDNMSPMNTFFVHVPSLDNLSSTSSLEILACSIDLFPDTATSLHLRMLMLWIHLLLVLTFPPRRRLTLLHHLLLLPLRFVQLLVGYSISWLALSVRILSTAHYLLRCKLRTRSCRLSLHFRSLPSVSLYVILSSLDATRSSPLSLAPALSLNIALLLTLLS
ncbi:hypothetical protein RJ640_024772 [Escallonia rubra]|uniref:Cullin N-terminal domain-containing protein n=1 Tax=Escallonia rubra TaxID=112253 RepID=A0AA88R6F4_9ASTE|nr:hypothetical protein RJ640_024772 [Escallonia rubra]